ncbi:hypothetical protein BCR33DRAFT_724302 [Rhizoclosmatium globosum]|uniref:Uncharacterized protein n=1 Tax=Rhizoclosmatium globosum TaxID=329046 RepID=A0A1Y2B7M8_9FUNG|nr:hypothetical protein BCR33DRAFT_724302 [Rhizoclosmatium globosum]|eukprot:ORY30477.1 hypothetical protein BCR33DRAFT_724302 [Rhizoclosmatium globosum]
MTAPPISESTEIQQVESTTKALSVDTQLQQLPSVSDTNPSDSSVHDTPPATPTAVTVQTFSLPPKVTVVRSGSVRNSITSLRALSPNDNQRTSSPSPLISRSKSQGTDLRRIHRGSYLDPGTVVEEGGSLPRSTLAAQTKIMELEAALEATKKELQIANSKADEMRSDHLIELARIKTELGSNDRQRHEAPSERDESKSKTALLEAEVLRLQETQAFMESELESSLNESIRLNIMNSDEKAKHESVIAELRAANSKMEQELTSTNEKQTEAHAVKDKTIGKLLKESNFLISSVEEIMMQQRVLKTSIQEKQRTNASLNEYSALLAKRLKDSIAKSSHLESETGKLTSRLSEKEAALEAEIQKCSELARELKESTEKESKLTIELVNTHHETEALKTNHDSILLETRTRLESTISQNDQVITDLRAELAETTQKLDESRTKAVEMETNLLQSRSAKEEQLLIQLDESLNVIDILKTKAVKDYESSQSQIEEANEIIKEKQSIISDLTEKIDSATRKQEACDMELVGVKEERDKLEASILQLKTSLIEVENNYRQQLDDFKTKATEDLAAKEALIAEMKTDGFTDRLETKLKESENQNATLSSKIMEQEALITKLNKRLAIVEKNLELLNARNNTLRLKKQSDSPSKRASVDFRESDYAANLVKRGSISSQLRKQSYLPVEEEPETKGDSGETSIESLLDSAFKL